jgi:hypothetical protein
MPDQRPARPPSRSMQETRASLVVSFGPFDPLSAAMFLRRVYGTEPVAARTNATTSPPAVCRWRATCVQGVLELHVCSCAKLLRVTASPSVLFSLNQPTRTGVSVPREVTSLDVRLSQVLKDWDCRHSDSRTSAVSRTDGRARYEPEGFKSRLAGSEAGLQFRLAQPRLRNNLAP